MKEFWGGLIIFMLVLPIVLGPIMALTTGDLNWLWLLCFLLLLLE